jgi:hypothetical protein
MPKWWLEDEEDAYDYRSVRPPKDELMVPYLARTSAFQRPPTTPLPAVTGPVDQFGVSAIMRDRLKAEFETSRPFPTDDEPLQFTTGDIDFGFLADRHDSLEFEAMKRDPHRSIQPNPWVPGGYSENMRKWVAEAMRRTSADQSQ